MSIFVIDTHFLTDEQIARDIVGLADLAEDDIVFETGAGKGFLTRFIARHAHVIAVEKEDFSELRALAGERVSVIFGDALPEMSVLSFSKVVCNPPFTILESMLRILALRNFKIAVLVAPSLFALRVKGDFFFSSLFGFHVAFPIPPQSFSPRPRASTVALVVRRKADARSHFIASLSSSRRKVKNFCAEYCTSVGLTRREARRLVSSIRLGEKIGEKESRKLTSHEMSEVYGVILSGVERR